jgi:hypothetical protein
MGQFIPLEEFKDKTIACIDVEKNVDQCRGTFVFSAGEQQFYIEREMRPPRRCAPCRRIKRNEMGGPSHAPAVRRDDRKGILLGVDVGHPSGDTHVKTIWPNGSTGPEISMPLGPESRRRSQDAEDFNEHTS